MSVTPRRYFTRPATAPCRGLVAGERAVWRPLTNPSPPVETVDGRRDYETQANPGRQPGLKSGERTQIWIWRIFSRTNWILSQIQDKACELYCFYSNVTTLRSDLCYRKSVRRLWRSCALLRGLKFSTIFFRRFVPKPHLDLHAKYYEECPKGTPPSGRYTQEG